MSITITKEKYHSLLELIISFEQAIDQAKEVLEKAAVPPALRSTVYGDYLDSAEQSQSTSVAATGFGGLFDDIEHPRQGDSGGQSGTRTTSVEDSLARLRQVFSDEPKETDWTRRANQTVNTPGTAARDDKPTVANGPAEKSSISKGLWDSRWATEEPLPPRRSERRSGRSRDAAAKRYPRDSLSDSGEETDDSLYRAKQKQRDEQAEDLRLALASQETDEDNDSPTKEEHKLPSYAYGDDVEQADRDYAVREEQRKARQEENNRAKRDEAKGSKPILSLEDRVKHVADTKFGQH